MVFSNMACKDISRVANNDALVVLICTDTATRRTPCSCFNYFTVYLSAIMDEDDAEYMQGSDDEVRLLEADHRACTTRDTGLRL